MSAAQVAAGGMTPEQAPVSAMRTPSAAGIEGSHGPAATPASDGPASGWCGAAASTSSADPPGPPCAHPNIQIAAVAHAALRICRQAGHGPGAAHLSVVSPTD